MSGPGAAPLSGLPSGAASDPLLPAARQVAAALARAAESGQTAIELRLSPEELGTVRLRLDASGDGLSVSIQAERGETLDLMRRNIDLLSQHLRDIGYDSARFVFSQGGSASDNAYAPPPHPTSEPGTSAAPEVPTVPPPVLWLGDRLDIRL